MRIIRAASTCLLIAELAYAQGNLGGITGNTLDASGAIITDVQITLRSLETNSSHSAMSGAGGYRLQALPPGVYRLEAEKTGFKKFVLEQVSILTATVATLDIKLEVGAVSDSVTVTAEQTGLETSSPEVSTVMSRKALLDLPIQVGAPTTGASGRRQPESFIFLTPGVVGNAWSKNINGNPDFSQDVLVDGVSAQITEEPGFLGQTSPPYEAVEEFKVQNTLFPAEYGRGLGVINYTLKSGTNQFHGDAFEFVRNDKFDARPFFAKTRPIVRFNEWGGWFGGPVWIPKLYNGRNRTFFNFNYTGIRNSPPISGSLTSTPPQAFRQGDFSSYTDAKGNLIPIYDPASTQPDGTRMPFAGNVIPGARQSKVAQNALALLPLPDLPGYFNNYINRQANPVQDDLWSLKLDQVLTSNQRLSFSMWRSLFDQLFTDVWGRNASPYGTLFTGHDLGNNFRLNYEYNVRPNLLHHFAFGYTLSSVSSQADSRIGNKIIQLPGVPEGAPGFPSFFVTNNYGNALFGNSHQQPQGPSEDRNYGFVDSLTWIKGKHQLKAGVDIRFFTLDSYDGRNGGGLSGDLAFSPTETSNLTAPNSGLLGNGWASFLLGQVDNGQRLIPEPSRRLTNQVYSYYVEDVWKVTKRFTLTLGLRHEVPTIVKEPDGRQSSLNLSLTNLGAGGRPGALAFLKPGQALVNTYLHALSPRVGIAYSVDSKTVIRSGFGIFYSPTNATTVGRMGTLFNAGYSFIQNFTQLTGGRQPVFLLDDGIPSFTGTLPNTSPTLLNNNNIDFMNPGAAKPGYVNTWTFDIQRELPFQFVVDAAYVGQKGVALPSGLENINQVDAKYLSLGNLLNASITSTAAQAAGFGLPYPGFTGSVSQALRAYPQYTGINDMFQPIGWNTYNALQIRLQKRYSSGLWMMVSYTASKNFISGGAYSGFGDSFPGASASTKPLDTANRKLEKRLARFDQPQNMIISWSYELPVGAGKKFLGSAHGPLNLLVGGWQANAIQRYNSGPPISVSGGGPIPLFNGGNRPDRVSGAPVRTNAARSNFDPARDLYLNVAAFAQPAPFTFGNAPPALGDVRNFGLFNEDFSVLKDFQIHERHKLQFRAEFFNIFNRVVFGGPSTNLNSPASFGRISGQSNSPRYSQLGLKYIF